MKNEIVPKLIEDTKEGRCLAVETNTIPGRCDKRVIDIHHLIEIRFLSIQSDGQHEEMLLADVRDDNGVLFISKASHFLSCVSNKSWWWIN